MAEAVGDDGCPRYTVDIELDDAGIGRTFGWGVMLDGPAGPNVWAITTELPGSTDRKREFVLQRGQETQIYYLSRARALGANKLMRPGNVVAARFAVWAPNAQAVSLIWGNTVSGYVADDGTGQDAAKPVIVLRKTAPNGANWNGVWETDPAEAVFQDFNALVAQPYMYQLKREGEADAVMRTDIYSRSQLGTGDARPPKDPVPVLWRDLDGIVACSIVCDPDVVTANVADLAFPPANTIGPADFWAEEFDAHNPVPTRLRDMSIYILHVGGLGFGGPPGSPGTLKDAINHLDHVVNLGMNTICLMPISQYEGRASWGYGTSHFFAPDFAAGGRDLLKHFIKECHKKGIAVILDVVYNHFAVDTDRAEWEYDSPAPERNIYFEYIGAPGDYPNLLNGYVNNGSSGFAPRMSEENVRSMFISSAIDFAVEFHIDGFRLDLTSALHASSTLNMQGAPSAGAANLAGQKFLREFNMTLDLIKPGLVIVAEDYSNWPPVTQPTRSGGLGFDAIWYVDFYHHLIGDSGKGPDYADLLRIAAASDAVPLALDYFAGALVASASASVVYHESHDEAGNAEWMLNGVKGHTARTIAAAVNRAPLFGATRWWAEARCRYAAGMTFLAPGTPMFFMGEEVGFQNDYTYNGFLGQREDFAGLRIGTGAALFRFYQDLIRFRERRQVVRGAGIDVLHIHNANRVLAFRRSGEGPDVVVAMSLSAQPFSNGYVIPLPHSTATVWKEVFNSDSRFYGGNDVGNGSSRVQRNGDTLNVVLPAAGFVVLEAQV